MEKLNKYIEERVSRITVYLSDLKSIYNIFEETSNEIEITADGYRYETIEELLNHCSEIKRVRFYTSNPNIAVNISENGARLYCSEDNLKCAGIITKFETIFLRRKRHLDDFFETKWILFYILLLSLFVVGFILSIANKNLNILLSFLAIDVPLLLSFVYATYVFSCQKSNIIMKNKEDVPSFWKKNKDKIILGLICSLFTVLLTLTAQKFMKIFEISPDENKIVNATDYNAMNYNGTMEKK